MSCAKMLQVFSGYTIPQPVDLAVQLCLSPPLHLLAASSLKTQQPQSQSPQLRWRKPTSGSLPSLAQTEAKTLVSIISKGGRGTRKKNVVFADALGLSLTVIRFFDSEDDASPSVRDCGVTVRSIGWTDRVAEAGSVGQGLYHLQLGFSQPWMDYPAFLARLAVGLVHLESCSVMPWGLSGTARVRNASFKKAVHVRITFDSWHSYRDVPCTYLRQCLGGTGENDLFVFEIPLPQILDPEKRIEFCISYRPGAFAEPLWDNNRGQNYHIVVCANPEAVCPAFGLHPGSGRKPLLRGPWCP